jgi:hypothetical protein
MPSVMSRSAGLRSETKTDGQPRRCFEVRRKARIARWNGCTGQKWSPFCPETGPFHYGGGSPVRWTVMRPSRHGVLPTYQEINWVAWIWQPQTQKACFERQTHAVKKALQLRIPAAVRIVHLTSRPLHLRRQWNRGPRASPLDGLIGGEPAPSANRTYFNPNLPAFGLKYGPPGKRP